MPLPRKEIYNPLNGDEIKHLLMRRCEQILDSVPYLQRHITLDRVKMNLAIDLEVWNGSIPVSTPPETHSIGDSYEITDEQDYTNRPSDETAVFQATINASPTPGGKVPDQIRDEERLSSMQPERVTDSTGKKICVADVPTLDGRVVEEIPGVRIDRTGHHTKQRNSTFVEMDRGPAGIADPNIRDARRDGTMPLRNTDRSGKVESPRIQRDR